MEYLNFRLNLENKARQLGLPTFMIQDAGRTQVAFGSRTVLGIFGKKKKPNFLVCVQHSNFNLISKIEGEKVVVDKVTGTLKLLQ